MLSKKLLKTLRGQINAPPPLWFMRQAGRTLPEYKKVRATVGSFMDLCLNPELAARVTLQPVERFDLDAAILFSDILIVPYGLGYGLTFEEGAGPIVTGCSLAAPHPFEETTFYEKTAPIYETVTRVRAALTAEKALIGFAGGPWTVASYLFPVVTQGAKKDRFAPLLSHLIPQGVAFEPLLETLTTATIYYLDQQIRAGAEVIQLFESWAGVLSPPLFRAWVLGPLRKIISAVKERHPQIPIIIFLKEASGYLSWIIETLGDLIAGISLDHHVDPSYVRAVVPTTIALQGGLDPRIVLAGGSILSQEVDRLLTAFADRPYIFNLSHGFLPETPLEHIDAIVQQVRKFQGVMA